MTINLEARKQKLIEDMTKVNQEIEHLRGLLEQRLQTRERMMGAVQMLDELLQAPETPVDNSPK